MAAIGVQATIPSCLKFPVRSREVALVSPAKPTPYEFKTLSDIDDQDALRFQLPLLWFYSNASTTPFSSVDIGISGGKCQREVGRVIRDALSEALVYYYPLAGRIRESPSGKLTIECNGEGVLYIEADADIRLEQFGPRIQPPFSCDQLLSKTLTESNGILNTPVLVIQVTHLLCGGFVFATRLNHCMMDGSGIAQFLGAVAEIARGAKTPSILPVWEREMITAREPPRVTHTHHEYLNLSTPAATTISSLNNSSSIVAKYNNNINNNTDHIVSSFFFGKAQISALRNRLPPHLKDTSSRFEIITACLWRSRTLALSLEPTELVCLSCVMGSPQGRQVGYYGNLIAFVGIVTTSKKNCILDGDYLFSLDQQRILPCIIYKALSPTTHYSTPKNGEEGVVVPLSLPKPFMDRLLLELQEMTG
ncbi:hypothetical protein H6P81_006274 [Aristolochia fimbriata]|uniref:Uncharacterized protein n=1 Tax=Aristolochia fimbriata TaxID=158543 RepID=A0AAV7EZ19_ARIFI|nr:hypothetical protein H6P81_006274 [Aristolochia fimbriata]